MSSVSTPYKTHMDPDPITLYDLRGKTSLHPHIQDNNAEKIANIFNELSNIDLVYRQKSRSVFPADMTFIVSSDIEGKPFQITLKTHPKPNPETLSIPINPKDSTTLDSPIDDCDDLGIASNNTSACDSPSNIIKPLPVKQNPPKAVLIDPDSATETPPFDFYSEKTELNEPQYANLIRSFIKSDGDFSLFSKPLIANPVSIPLAPIKAVPTTPEQSKPYSPENENKTPNSQTQVPFSQDFEATLILERDGKKEELFLNSAGAFFAKQFISKTDDYIPRSSLTAEELVPPVPDLRSLVNGNQFEMVPTNYFLSSQQFELEKNIALISKDCFCYIYPYCMAFLSHKAKQNMNILEISEEKLKIATQVFHDLPSKVNKYLILHLCKRNEKSITPNEISNNPKDRFKIVSKNPNGHYFLSSPRNQYHLIFGIGILSTQLLTTPKKSDTILKNIYQALTPNGYCILSGVFPPLLSSSDFSKIGFEIENMQIPNAPFHFYVLKKPYQEQLTSSKKTRFSHPKKK